MKLYKLLLAVLKVTALILLLFFAVEVGRAYYYSLEQPFTIHLDELEYDLFLEEYELEGSYDYKKALSGRQGTFTRNEIYAYDILGKHF